MTFPIDVTKHLTAIKIIIIRSKKKGFVMAYSLKTYHDRDYTVAEVALSDGSKSTEHQSGIKEK